MLGLHFAFASKLVVRFLLFVRGDVCGMALTIKMHARVLPLHVLCEDHDDKTVLSNTRQVGY